jgi:hypothetical protein
LKSETKINRMKKFQLFLLLAMQAAFSNAQNCPVGISQCSIDIFVAQDSCTSSPQTFYIISSQNFSTKVCATDVPSAPAANGAPCCDTSVMIKAHVYTPPCGIGTITASTIKSVSFKLIDSTLINYLGQPTAVGADARVILRSPAGTMFTLISPKPANTDFSSPIGNYCYCPTFTPDGSSGSILNTQGPYNLCYYSPEGGPLSSIFIGENPHANSGVWTLYVNDNTDTGGQSFNTLRIADFCMTFNGSGFGANSTYTWTSDSANCLSYLSDLNTANPVFTPPAGYYDCTYYLFVYDSVCGCLASDTMRVSCPEPQSVPSVNNTSIVFNASVYYSEITFTYPSASGQREIIINDINGREVMHYNLPQWSSTQTLKLPQMARGIYVARLLIPNSQFPIPNVKFVVE